MKFTTVEEADHDIRLDRWFSRYYPELTHVQLQQALRKKLIRVDNKKAEANQRLQTGQVIKHPEFVEGAARPAPKLQKDETAWLKEAILFQNKHIIALNKPAGLATQGGTGQSTHLDRLLPALQGDAPTPPKLVHRLDRDTSGVLLLARHAKAADVLMKLFAAREVQKTYWALTSGVPHPPEGEIKLPLSKQRRGGQERMYIDKREGKKAHTSYRVVERMAARLAWVELTPHTGRTHQLRVHLEALEAPIIGDPKYGGYASFPEGLNISQKMHLHARHLLIADFMGDTLDITAPLPPHMEQSWKTLGISS